MPSIVKTQHPQYAAMSDRWQRCRDVVAGSDAVKAAGIRYLPKLKDQEETDYQAYKTRASWFGATWRTVSALSGMLFRKAPELEVAESVKPLLDDVTLTGKSLFVFSQQIALEALTTGRIGILIDYPEQTAEGLTLADAQALNLRPIMASYPAESIINWKTERIGNATVLSLLVLTEQADLPGHEFEHKTETRYRVLDLATRKAEEGAAENEGRVYRVRVFRVKQAQQGGAEEDEQIGPDLYPLMNGKPLPYIPFVFLGVDDTTPEVDEPPLIDLVDLNLAHYRTDADYRHGLHFTGLPTAVISGYTPEDKAEKMYVGSASAWCFPDPQASASFLEFTGQGLQALEKALDKMEQLMAILGARLLSSEKKAVETAQTAQIHRAGESSVLASIAQTLGDGLTKSLTIFCQWAGSPGEGSVEINREFLPPEVTPQELTAWLQSWQAGAPGFSDQGFFDLLKSREVVREDVTLEDEQERIASKRPPEPNPGDGATGEDE